MSNGEQAKREQQQTVTLENQTSDRYTFVASAGSNSATQNVAGNSSWVIPFQVPLNQWLTIQVASLGFCYQALNSKIVYFADEGGAYVLNCQAGIGGGGCDTQQCPQNGKKS